MRLQVHLWKCAHQFKPDIMGPAGRGWKFQQGKELDPDWCQGSLLPAELIDTVCDDPLQTEEAADDDTELVSLCDSVQEKACCEDAVRNRQSTRPISLHNYGWLFLLIFLWIYSLLCENNRDRSSREFTYRTSESLANTF